MRWNAMAGRAGLKTEKKGAATPRERGGQKAGSAASAAPDTHVAAALRTAYEEAVREDVPPEFLDLLGKLS